MDSGPSGVLKCRHPQNAGPGSPSVVVYPQLCLIVHFLPGPPCTSWGTSPRSGNTTYPVGFPSGNSTKIAEGRKRKWKLSRRQELSREVASFGLAGDSGGFEPDPTTLSQATSTGPGTSLPPSWNQDGEVVGRTGLPALPPLPAYQGPARLVLSVPHFVDEWPADF
jgi:hypothetical protein